MGFFWCEAMLDQGVYMHPWHNMFICDALTDEDVRTTVDAAERSFRALSENAATLGPNERLIAFKDGVELV